MAPTDLLRASRDGDQFHYHWAARQALRLLQPGTALKAIFVEGVSDEDTTSTAGDEVVDLAEYWGSANLSTASRIVYRQLKHSTVNSDKEQTSSYLKKTLSGFAKKYQSIFNEHPDVLDRVSFEFISVSPIAQTVKDALADIISGREPLSAEPAAYIRSLLAESLDPEQFPAFLKSFIVRDNETGLLCLRHALHTEVASFLPGAAAEHDILLREMVSTRATSIAGFDPIITRTTVLTALQTTEDDLLPAPNLIETPNPVFHLPQVAELAQILVNTPVPVLAHATGGMGKSVLASTIGGCLPQGSVAVVYDCFGNGTYRRLSNSRHAHRQAFLQISNELAAQSLCGPMLPSNTADSRAYMLTFLDRIATAAHAVTENSPEAILLLVIDAADNAVMAASHVGVEAFVSDLMGEDLPLGARLLVLSRTERRNLLRPTSACIDVPLRGFDEENSRTHLASRFGPVSKDDGAEFHHLTHGNPRVQALVMQNASNVEDVLQSLGEVQPDSAEQFAHLMAQRLEAIRNDLGKAADQVERLCLAMAALRPRIPVDVLATIARVEPAFVRSFASEFGRSIFLGQDTIQFRDEPTETWFRSTFSPNRQALLSLIEDVRPLAETHPYLSATLPQLLFEAELVRELVDLALSDDGLAAASDLERREVAHQRAQFALKAALRAGLELDAARLAWAAGGLHAGETRRVKLIRANTDLAGEFLNEQTIDSLLASRALAGEWPGSQLHVEGALLAATGDVHQARSRLRSAEDWTRQWVHQAIARDEKHNVSVEDIAELAMGILTVSGAAACVRFLGTWSPSWVAYQVGRRVAVRLVDRNNIEALEELAVAAGKIERLQLAVVSVASEADIFLGPAAVRRTIRMLNKHREPVRLNDDRFDGLGTAQRTGDHALAVALTLSLGTRHGHINSKQAQEILTRYLPPTLQRDAGSQFDHGAATRGLLFAFTLNSVLQNQNLDPKSIAAPAVQKELEAPGSPRTRESADFVTNIIPLTRWMQLSVESMTQERSDTAVLLERFDALAATDFKRHGDYEPPRLLINSIARLATRLLSQLPAGTQRHDAFTQWLTSNFRHLTWPTVFDVVRISSRCDDMHQLTVEAAGLLRDVLETDDSPAEERYEALISLARATYAFDPAESRAHFDAALDITSRLGDDVHERWHSVSRIAKSACDTQEQPARAYRLAQVAESLQSYLGGDSAVAVDVLPQIQRLSAQIGIPIASRWRDRRVASTGELVHALTSGEAAALSPYPRWALGMLPLGAADSRVHLSALGHPGERDRRDAEAVIDGWLRPFTRTEPTSSTVDIHSSYSSSLVTVEIAGPDAGDPATPQLFAGFDLTTPANWDAAVLLAGEGGGNSWIRRKELLDYATSFPANRLRLMLEAATNSSRLELHDYNGLVERLVARTTRLPVAAGQAVAELVDRLVERFAKKLTTSGYDPVNLSAIESLCRRPPTSVEEAALRQLGSLPELLTSSECYQLAARLSGRVSASDSGVVLDDALASFSRIATAEASDGPVEHLPTPPADVASRVAAFVWCAAGDPAKATRWNAAHTIRLWIALGCTDLVEALVQCANGAVDVTAFVGSGLVFYDKHALMWTLMALARSCDDDRSLTHLTHVAPLFPLLRRVAFDDPPHAVLQRSARDVLRRLHEVHAVALTPGELDQLTASNHPTVVVEEQYGSRPTAVPVRLEGPDPDHDLASAGGDLQMSGRSRTDTRFSFFMDFKDHWCAPLGRAFGATGQRVLQLVDEVIVDRWGLPFRGNAVDDRRYGPKLYADGSTYVHKFSWPAEDDLDFYIALHALYEVAGHLTRHYPAFQSPDNDQDDFAQWLGDHVPTREDGRWVFDRRDPVPPDLTDADAPSPLRASGASGREWLLNMPASRFKQLVSPSDDWVTTDGYWTETFWDRYEIVTVHGVLVKRGAARALLAALQTAPDLDAMSLPNNSEHDDSVSGRAEHYRVVEVAHGEYPREGIDTQDPNATDIGWPPTRPSDTVIATLGLTADRDQRNWLNARGPQVTTAVWNTGSEHESQGRRLQIHVAALAELLAREQRALILSVNISRNLNTRYLTEDEDDATAARQPRRKFFLLRADGTDIEFVD